MKTAESQKLIFIIVGLLVVAAAIYFYMSGNPSDSSSLLVEEGTSEATVSSNRIVVLLNQINSLKIDSSFFSSQTYASLVDHTVPIYDQNIGKSNPFYNPNRRASASR